MDSSSQQRETACTTYKTPFVADADPAKQFQSFSKEAVAPEEYVNSNMPMRQVKLSKLKQPAKEAKKNMEALRKAIPEIAETTAAPK